MDRSTSKETATKIVNTVATDHVGVKAKDRISCVFSAILNNLTHRPQTLPQIQPPKIPTLHYTTISAEFPQMNNLQSKILVLDNKTVST